MRKRPQWTHRWLWIVGSGAVLAACGGGGGGGGGGSMGPAPNSFTVTNLVSDGSVMAAHTDSALKNPWGVAFGPGPVWVANNHTNTLTAYDGSGATAAPAINVPPGTRGDAAPTGMVSNSTGDFKISDTAGPAVYIFDGEGGTIAAWAPSLGANAVTKYDDGAGGAIYKGLALAVAGGANRLYAADFHNNKIDVFDQNYQKVSLPAGRFVDAALPAGFAPYNVQNIDNKLYVAYAKQDADAEDQTCGPGLGAVDVYDPDGNLIQHFASGVPLNAPWGMTLAASTFGPFAGDLLIGNFCDGAINAFDPISGTFKGALKNPSGGTIQIPGLWGLAFGNGALNQSRDALYFAAGINDENNGVYGAIKPAGGASACTGYGC
jgi:uncharacterized protein (TIGR03118 family)